MLLVFSSSLSLLNFSFGSIIVCLLFLTDFTHYILFIIKFVFTKNLIKKELLEALSVYKYNDPSEELLEKYKDYEDDLRFLWFYSYDETLIGFLSVYILLVFFVSLFLSKMLNEEKIFFLNQINRININPYFLLKGFSKLNEKKKIN